MVSLSVGPTRVRSPSQGTLKGAFGHQCDSRSAGAAPTVRSAVGRAVADTCGKWGIAVDLIFEDDLPETDVVMLHVN